MSSIDILREISNENNGLILTKVAVEKGISRSNLSKLCDNGKITRIANCQYHFQLSYRYKFCFLCTYPPLGYI